MSHKEPTPQFSDNSGQDGPRQHPRRERSGKMRNRLIAAGLTGAVAVGAAFLATGEGEPKKVEVRHSATVELGGQESVRVIEATKRIIADLGTLNMAAMEGGLRPNEAFTATVTPEGSDTLLATSYTNGSTEVQVGFRVAGDHQTVDDALAAEDQLYTPYPDYYAKDEPGDANDDAFKVGVTGRHLTVQDVTDTSTQASETDATMAVNAVVAAEEIADFLDSNMQNAG